MVGVGWSRETKVDTLSKGKAIPYGRIKGILFREKKQTATAHSIFQQVQCLIKNIFQFVS